MKNNVNIDSEHDIFNYILTNQQESDNFYKVLEIIKEKVKLKIDKKELSDIIKNYRNFTYDLSWINSKYKELVIEQITEDLINDDIIYYYEKKR